MGKYCQRNLEKKCDMYMIIIKIYCCGRPQTSSDTMWFERLDVLRCYVAIGLRKWFVNAYNMGLILGYMMGLNKGNVTTCNTGNDFVVDA